MTARRTRRNALLAVIAMSAISGWSEDSQDPLPRGWTRGVAVSPEVQALYEVRDRDLAAGTIAMQDMEENPHRGIDAAILFGTVLSVEDAGQLLPTGTVDDKTKLPGCEPWQGVSAVRSLRVEKGDLQDFCESRSPGP